jgi:hypothetical protein
MTVLDLYRPTVPPVLAPAPDDRLGALRHRSVTDELAAAVARHADDPSAGRWAAMAESLQLTALAVSVAWTGEDDGAAALLAACAESAVLQALGDRLAERADVRALPFDRATSFHRLTRTATRVAGVVLGAAPADDELVGRALHAHLDALRTWQSVLVRVPAADRRAG